MKVLIGQIPVLVVLVTCTVCGASTTEPTKTMIDRHGELITDGCGSCSLTPARYPGIPPGYTPGIAPRYARPAALALPWPCPPRRSRRLDEEQEDQEQRDLLSRKTRSRKTRSRKTC